ncbi:hypothetical protein [Herbaspirillum sp. CAH-3]|uniref:hypothetical protein n=1 Tax=Herbaspirillum sp. CAH-3 TaxID=2605746 RepID=UPI0012AC6D6B|nr:hypothetical protein [Herbaspirillum sp. CAH-3]MRT28211.1 hypothetical protein [Herbaspirillum sp. CAH-3]
MDSHALARWAATTSATLVLIKIVERWRALRQIDASVALSSTSKLGNKVYLHNVTDRPIIITHWRIYMASGLRHQRDVKEIDRAESGAHRITIAPLSSHVLFFSMRIISTEAPSSLTDGGSTSKFVLRASGPER